ncbi:hypothetical protein Gorai_019581 [Gossypium raimondii]|uniref:Uncharacterized protein n=1 Tax=Gossypium raimondii TaxID=29730 RepID=A0A7J8PPV8_GOSRA|nr:hypothetical protein [Gossypium raimondii]
MEITERDGSDKCDLVNRSTKKVRIRDIEENRDGDMETTTVAGKTLSWKDRLLGIGFYPNERTTNTEGIEEDEDFELSEEDVERSSTNGIIKEEPQIHVYMAHGCLSKGRVKEQAERDKKTAVMS